MALTDKDIKKLSQLAKINIDSKDEEIVLSKLEGIMKLIDSMQKVNTDNIEPRSHALDTTQPLREDVVSEKNQKNDFLKLGPESNEDYFIVPRVVE
jgi:aspartyl-tRNA(Asn)/glutamyl-tRNA(Gln) amidotransferase subunit C